MSDGRTRRQQLLEAIGSEPQTISALARRLGLTRHDIGEDVPHLLRSARAAGIAVEVIPARCKACGFTFAGEVLDKPGRCPSCKGTRLHEPMLVRTPG
jgi:predicted Zn-ribbon and HTH transcriptional regulator